MTSLRQRLLSGAGATALGPAITAVIQIASVPVFLRVWSPTLYGEWLIMSTIPAYLAMSDLGFGTVAANDMTLRMAADDKAGALETFQSAWVLIVLLSTGIALLTAGTLLCTGLVARLGLHAMSLPVASSVLLWLSVYALSALHTSVINSAFRASGKYALGLVYTNILRALENAAMFITILLGRGPVDAAVSLALTRVVGNLVLNALLSRSTPDLKLGIRCATLDRIKELTRPSLAFMAIPSANLITIQGINFLVGVLMGPLALASFGPLRTLTRLAFQLNDTIKNGAWPELTVAFGERNTATARKIHRASCVAAVWGCMLLVAVLLFAGGQLFARWTHGRLAFDRDCFTLLLLVLLVNSLWNTSSAVQLAANQHGTFAKNYLISSLLCFALATPLVRSFGLVGAALALLGVDVWMTFVVVPRSNALVLDTDSQFFAQLFSVRSVGRIVANVFV